MNIKDKLNPLAASLLLFFAPMVMLVFLDYVWFSDILYFLPFYAVTVAAILWDKHVFGFVFLSGFVLGMAADYVTHLMERPYPTMRGGFLFIALVAAGAIVGLAAQYLWGRHRKKGQK